MVYIAKAGISFPEVFILIWLIIGLLPLTLTAGLSLTGSVEANASATSPPPTAIYNCPTSCQCEYSSSSQKLEISCSLVSHIRLEDERTTTRNSIDLSSGVRILRISHALVDAKSVQKLLPPLVKQNMLVELDLEYVIIEPKSLFTSNLFKESSESLRKITIKAGNHRGDFADIPAASFRQVLQPLASLKNMDSLTICDSSPSLATIVLQAMPVVNHLQAVNNSLYEIPYESLTNQYSIQSIEFSKNHIAMIPNGLLDGLANLVTLDVSQNRIFHLQEQVFTGLKALRKLNISQNKIEYVDAEVFTPLQDIQTVDLSHNEVVQFFEPYFINNKKLKVLNMSNMWVAGTFTKSDTSRRSLMETEQLISTLQNVEKLDLSANGMKAIPETLTHAPNLLQVFLDGNPWECSCQDRWFLDWIATSKVSIGDRNSTDNMWCFQHKEGVVHRRSFYQYLKNLTRTCTNNNIIARTPYKFQAVMGKDKQLNCHAQKPNWPKITWVTPSKQRISGNTSDFHHESRNQEGLLEPRLASDGSLYLTNVTGIDYGLYLCIASYEDLNVTHYVHLGMDTSIFRDVRFMSIMIGWTFSFAFLALVLLGQLVKFILCKLGVKCVTVSTTAQTRRVRAFFDSMDQHKNSQLDWLRDNYNMQAKKIKDNCYSQLERIRESYSNQGKNLGEIRDFGTHQLNTLKDQYNDQVRRVASYSAHRLCKVRENYVFKRNQVCKFSSHQLLRIRETYKWQAQTLNKILENLPKGLNFDTCRGMAACGRTESIYLDDMGAFYATHEVEADVYQLSNGLKHENDTMEHISLLIPPEFVIDFKRGTVDGITNDKLVLTEQEEDDERKEEQGTSEGTSTPSTAVMESDTTNTAHCSSYSETPSSSSSNSERATENV